MKACGGDRTLRVKKPAEFPKPVFTQQAGASAIPRNRDEQSNRKQTSHDWSLKLDPGNYLQCLTPFTVLRLADR